MGCAVQTHKSSEQWGTWVANTINGWYLQTSHEHYWCHQIYVKKTKSERISDTVFFKHRYLTQPSVTPVDRIIKALGDSTQALKGRRNLKGIEQIKALTQNDELLNNILTTNKTPTGKVTFYEATKPPQEVQTAPRVNNISNSVKEHTAINTAIINKPLTINTPPPRVETSIDKISILNMPPPRVVESSKADREKIMLNPNRIKLWQHISNSANNRARIHHCHQMALCNNNQREHVQFVCNTDTGNYLNYWQLMRDTKHAKVWSESSEKWIWTTCARSWRQSHKNKHHLLYPKRSHSNW